MQLPFTVQQFLDVFARYNQAVWPAQILAYLFAVGCIALALSSWARAGRIILATLACSWWFMGAVYQVGFFAPINPAAYLFGALFVVQSLLFAGHAAAGGRIEFHPRADIYSITGALFILYAMIVYPLIGAAVGHGWPHSPSFGIAPCPATIFTFGVLLLARTHVPVYLLIIPTLWSVVGFTAAIKLGIIEDVGLVVAGVLGVALIWRRNSSMSGRSERHPRDRVLALLGLCGILSVFFIVTATVLGVALRPGADHVALTISELYEVGAPNAGWLMVFFTAYHALVVPLAVGLHRGLPRARWGWLGPLLLGAAGLFGLPLGAYARCDPGCFGATTFRGQLHGVLVLVTVPLIFGAMFATWRRLGRHDRWRRYARYTLVTAVVGLSFGLAMTPFVQGPHAGLLERISVGLLLQWYLVTGFVLLRRAFAPAN